MSDVLTDDVVLLFCRDCPPGQDILPQYAMPYIDELPAAVREYLAEAEISVAFRILVHMAIRHKQGRLSEKNFVDLIHRLIDRTVRMFPATDLARSKTEINMPSCAQVEASIRSAEGTGVWGINTVV